MKIEILFPVPTEARDFRRAGVGTHVSGVGIAARPVPPSRSSSHASRTG
ncbi:hypothetical protein LH442_11430 [Laribacter hongkongensis]|nr:hypothetical protein [Laribacter hongkongensis]MCG9056587.1 hypothetical protein [Laribacter hongkongensis]